jgi:hypothetical protein
MNTKRKRTIYFKKLRRAFFFGFLLPLAILPLATPLLVADAQKDEADIRITTNSAGREIAANERVELNLSRALKAGEGRLAVFIGATDVTALVDFEAQSFAYQAKPFAPLAAGENRLTIYLVEPDGNWKTMAEFSLRVKNSAPETVSTSEIKSENESRDSNVEFTPNVSLNVKGQNQTVTFPAESAPERGRFTDIDGQGNFHFKLTRRDFSVSGKFDFVGTSFRKNALRFGELQERAPLVDLSSYAIEFSVKDRVRVNLGHVSFGSNRHLINQFSSRGIGVNVPVGKQNEISFAAVNGTSVVGYDNFLGVTRRKHSIVGATFAREFFADRPGGLRVEFSAIRGSLLPLSNFNQGAVNDAEKSLGFGFRVLGSDKSRRLRYEAGLTRSKFTNPKDPLLEQNFDVTPVRSVWRSAHFAEISFDFVQGLKLWREKKLKVTGTFRNEEIQPLFRSVGAATQADRRQNQFEISGNFGEINFAYGNLRDRDNLNNVASILKTLNRRKNLVVGLGLGSFFRPEKPIRWLPAISYTYDHTHQFGAFLPVNGEFRDPSQVPDQHSFAQSFNAIWQLSDKFNVAYRRSRAFQDNRQPGRDRADFLSGVNAVALGTKPFDSLDLDFEVSRESQKNFEQPRIDQTFRFATRATWRTPFLKNSSFSANLSTTFAGDTNDTSDARNAEFDVQWAYKFGFGSKKFKKTEAQFFIRYANRYGETTDRVFSVNNFNRTQSFNFGLNFNVF